jgi:hypothetical protein
MIDPSCFQNMPLTLLVVEKPWKMEPCFLLHGHALPIWRAALIRSLKKFVVVRNVENISYVVGELWRETLEGTYKNI